MIDRCVEVVRDANEAIEGDRYFDAADFIISARGVFEAERLLETKGYDLAEGEGELGTVGDWTLACVAGGLKEASATLRKRGNTSVANRLRALEIKMLRRIAESPWCSPLVLYSDAFSALVDDCRKRRDPAGLIYQAGYLVHDLEREEGANVMGGLRDLGWLHFELGDPERAVGIFTKLLRHDPGDVWTHNQIAFVFARDLPELARAAAKRGLEVIGHEDPYKLARQLQSYVDEVDGKHDGTRPANTDALLEALRLAPAERKTMTLRKLCRSLAPETDLVEKKVREPLPDAAALRQLRQDLRTLPRPAPQLTLPLPPAVTSVRNSPPIATRTKVGRNDACPCGSGQKYKRCCAP
jgi:tetratricopeptide (TPR) repeat protein